MNNLVMWLTIISKFLFVTIFIFFVSLFIYKEKLFMNLAFPIYWNKSELIIDENFEIIMNDTNCPWFLYNSNWSKLYILYFHGNWVDLSQSQKIIKKIWAHFKSNVIAIDYPWYSKCKLPKSFSSLEIIKENLLKYLEVNKILPENTVLLSHSIWTTFVWLLWNINWKWIVMISPFYSYHDLISNRIHFDPFDFSKTRLLNIWERLQGFQNNITIIHGTNDDVINIQQGRKLNKSLIKINPRMIELNGYDHNIVNYIFETWFNLSY